MLSKWPIRDKLLVGLVLLLVIVAILAWGGINGLYAYRSLVRNIGRRVTELPLANQFTRDVYEMRIALNELRDCQRLPFSADGSAPVASQIAREELQARIETAAKSLDRYAAQLSNEESESRLTDSHREHATVKSAKELLSTIDRGIRQNDWLLDQARVGTIVTELDKLQELAAGLPTFLYENIREFSEEARTQYRSLIVLSWVTSTTAVVMLALLVKLFYQWIFRPLRILIKGSRKVAEGQFHYRIRLRTSDEMAGLASAMNSMTQRFCEIRDDLDHQVQERTKEVVRTERLASVGFLAAGVAHEINNPLASIALCAESLESRFADGELNDAEAREVAREYLHLIQTEAFRCKEITEKLLDFARIGEIKRQDTDLRGLVQDVVEMIGHLGRYQSRRVELVEGEPVVAAVNAQEMKQVVLNLIVNGLDSLDDGGAVVVEVRQRDGEAQIVVADNGCGMTTEVLDHLFEPFFTRRRQGQGTGLGLSISHRIVTDHHGKIEAISAGPGQGSRFVVHLPTQPRLKESSHRYQAA